jgi:hypothetical protein
MKLDVDQLLDRKTGKPLIKARKVDPMKPTQAVYG